MKPLTKEQGIVLTGYTGKLCCNFDDFHADAEKRTGEPILSHELASKEMTKLLQLHYREDFFKLIGANPEGRF